jgi:DNA-binding CsgD family transcriptional regulator
MADNLIDQVYEAAFVPERWAGVLDRLSILSASVGGVVLVASDRFPPRWSASQAISGALQAFSSGGAWRENDRPSRFLKAGPGSFLRDVDFLSEAYMAVDPMRKELVDHGLGWQTGTVIPMHGDEMVIYSFERRLDQGPHHPKVVGTLNALRPHLARAGLIALRLGLEQAQNTVSVLAALGLPAVVLSKTGRVIAGNTLFEELSNLFLPSAFGGLVIAEPAANKLFREVLDITCADREPLVRSIPVKPSERTALAVIHIVPLRRAAHDIFSGADLLVVVNEVGPGHALPAAALLSALFDLTPTEARVASGLAAGKSLKLIASQMGVSFGSVRTYLARIFAKTGASQQSQLVALLKSVQPMLPQVKS